MTKTTIGTAGSSPGLKSHNRVVEALRERKLSARESGGGGGDEGEIKKEQSLTVAQKDHEGIKTREENKGEIKKKQGLTVVQGLLYPPSDASFQEMDFNPARESKVRHAGNVSLFLFAFPAENHLQSASLSCNVQGT